MDLYDYSNEYIWEVGSLKMNLREWEIIDNDTF